jgi:hypothetical protein
MENLSHSGRASYKLTREILEMQLAAEQAWNDVYGRVTSESKKKINSPSNEGVRYSVIITNFEEATIWKIGAIKRHSLGVSGISCLWKTLLENKGDHLSMKILDSILKDDSKSISGADKTYYNLIDKLMDISGLPKSEIRGWFLKDKNGITLKNLE